MISDRPDLKRRNEKNPFSISKIEHALEKFKAKELYEDLETRIEAAKNSPQKEMIKNAVNALKQRLGGKTFSNEDFGRIEYVKLSLLDINIDNQRDAIWDHAADIIEAFDPRAVQVVNTILLPNGRYSVPEGQHTAIVLYILYKAGLLPNDFNVQCKVIDALAVVPGSKTKGEGFGNWLFRIINSKGRKSVEPYFMHKSRVSGVRNYGSEMLEDIHSEKIQTLVEDNNMFCRPAIEARGSGAKPGMITYITGLNKIAVLESEDFNENLKDLEWALGMHDRYFANEKGVDGGFILAFGRYHALARHNKLTITRDWQEALFKFFKHVYASPSKFHKDCKARLTAFQKDNDLKISWSDNALSAVLIMDFYKWCDENNENFALLPDKSINQYNGI